MRSDLKNNVIIPTGYMGSGSSAVTDILSEIEGYNKNAGSFEFVFLHCPNGLFDLEDKLLIGNTTIRSDEAVHSFQNCMTELYDTKNYWISGYKYKISDKFLEFCDDFLRDIGVINLKDTYWYYQQNPKGLKMHLKILYSKIYNRIPGLKKKIPLTYKNVCVAYPSTEVFFNSAKIFLSKIFNALGINEHNLVLDQLILPQNIKRMDHYFSDNVKVIVVDRDPRDVFLLNKYVWRRNCQAIPYPFDVMTFCNMYERMRKIDDEAYSSNVIRIHFEDLVFHYDDSLAILYKFLHINPDRHKNKGKVFNYHISRNNTCVYKTNTLFEDEAKIIEKKLNKYIYNFDDQLAYNEERNPNDLF